ncbi:MAG TPA: DUF3536 domain-containing protein, partial [Acidimicrobiia bacterium]
EGTSWSCAHGVDRWRTDCGCSSGLQPGWNQGWRGPLRQALDYLRDSLIDDFATIGSRLFHDPWLTRDEYISVVLGESGEEFLDHHCQPGLGGEERSQAIDLLEIQHRAMLMYTSCGWFFDDVSGIESVFVIRQAGRVIDLTRRATGMDLEPGFLEILDRAVSNVDDMTGRDVYERSVTHYLSSWE